MTAGETSDLKVALASARLPVRPPAVPSASLGVRLHTVPWLHGLLPARLALRRAQRRGAESWEGYPEERERARAAMTAVVGGTERAGEVEALAQQSLIESEAHRVLFWRPLRTSSIDASSQSHLDAALCTGRGVLLSSCHTGPVFQTMSVIAARGRGSFCVAAPWFFEQPSQDYWGRRVARWWRVAQTRREHVLVSKGSFPVLRALLAQGELVWLLFDMPGSRKTQFLDKSVMLSSGSAKLANESGALILPLRARREGHRTWVDVAPALDPGEFADDEDLHNALATVHERWILEQPAALEDPRRSGAWEGGATAGGWVRPGPGSPSGAAQHDGWGQRNRSAA
jgi:lauroyl/myristoyl acyltransferase